MCTVGITAVRTIEGPSVGAPAAHIVDVMIS